MKLGLSMSDANGGYTIRFNEKGIVVPPQTTDMPVGFFTAYFSLILPFVPFIRIPELGLPSVVLQYTPTFRSFLAAGLLSESKLEQIELVIFIHLLMRCAVFPVFRHKYLALFSLGPPPPIELRDAWPRQFVWVLKFGLAAIAISLTWGPIAKLLQTLTAKSLFCTLGALGVGLSLATEGLMDLGLYLTARRKYWRESS